MAKAKGKADSDMANLMHELQLQMEANCKLTEENALLRERLAELEKPADPVDPVEPANDNEENLNQRNYRHSVMRDKLKRGIVTEDIYKSLKKEILSALKQKNFVKVYMEGLVVVGKPVNPDMTFEEMLNEMKVFLSH